VPDFRPEPSGGGRGVDAGNAMSSPPQGQRFAARGGFGQGGAAGPGWDPGEWHFGMGWSDFGCCSFDCHNEPWGIPLVGCVMRQAEI